MRALVIADKQDITRWGITHLVRDMDEFQSVQEVLTKSKLREYISKHPTAVVLMDNNRFDMENFDEISDVAKEFVGVDWILFSDDFSDIFLKRWLLNKENFSLILKTDSLYQIRTAITAALKGETYICEQLTEKIQNYNRFSGHADQVLTHSEREILKEIASGKMTKVIALERNLSIHTITTHRKNIFKKLEINNVHDAIRYAIRAGIIERDDYTI
ncbi:response regulator transcription factor [Flavobacterium sp. NKUCC04_CG]|uniref:helix-turn-helix transcriptional regulator n=1 Tax=Flavobacterium sp. NKUCC04_CG TaxID=2842121 RepID=UPI001C5AE4B5|nr:response regulator transcription factor [Flavobacterium sp. NKUCC04_CG]MBW3520438.1 response regulator transcription factor [Flavobacterium sp. NKUCC04_CG]